MPDAPSEAGTELPRVIGRFTVDRLLGQGGMAAVYLATEETTHRSVAVKVMDPTLQKAPDFVQRFLNEAQATASLRHPNVVETLDHGESQGLYFIATEYLDGGNLSHLLRDMKELPHALAAELVTQLLAGLSHAHQKGIVHRDLKPENLLLSSGGILKVGDFGIARSADSKQQLTQTGMLIGTLGYMSPEQARGSSIDHRSDLYAVGIILYEMLTGGNPYSTDNPATSIARILANALPPVFTIRPAVPVELEQVLDRLLQPDPDARFATAQEAHDALVGLVSERRSVQPTLVAECIRRPQEMKQLLDRQAAAQLVTEAKALSAGNALEQNHAAVRLQYALLNDPENTEAKALLAGFKHVSVGPSVNPKIAELERYLEKYPETPQALQQMAQLYKMEGNLLQSAIYLKRFLRQRPSDAYAWTQLFGLTGERQPRAPSRLGPATRDLVAHVKTGGFAAPAMSPPSGPRTAVVPAPRASAPQPLPPLPAPLPEGLSALPPAPTPRMKRDLPPVVVWSVIGGTLAAVLLYGYRKVSQDIDRATLAQQRAGDALAQQQNLLEQKLMEERSRAELAARAAESERKAGMLLDDGVRELNAERYTHAQKSFDELIESYPKREPAARALFYRGKTLLALDKKTDAIRDLTAFLEKRPSSPDAAEALIRRAQAYARNLQFDDAATDFDTFFTQHPGNELSAEAHLSRAELYLVREKFEEARVDLDAVVAGASRPGQKDAAAALLAKLPAPKDKKP